MTTLKELRELAEAVVRIQAEVGRFDYKTGRWHEARDRLVDAREQLRSECTADTILKMLDVIEDAKAIAGQYSSAPDGSMGRGFTNGHFLRLIESLSVLEGNQ